MSKFVHLIDTRPTKWLEIGKQSVQLLVLSIDTRPTMWLEIREQCGEQNLWLGTRPTMWLEIEIEF